MADSTPYEQLPIEALQDLRRRSVENIERERRTLEMLEVLIRKAKNPAMHDLLTEHDRNRLLTSGGHIRDIAGWARKILKAQCHIMTASEMADVMYSHAWPLDPRAFRRRVIVAVSAIANLKDHGQRRIVVSGHKADNREVLWALAEWMNDGILMDQYKNRMK
jgi:hypothetical protein